MKPLLRMLLIGMIYFAVFIFFNTASQETKFIYFNF